MTMKHYIQISFLLLAVVLLTACDKLSMDEKVKGAPQITDFSPKSGSVGTLVSVSGEDLESVVEATVGGVQAQLVERVSKNLLTLKVVGAAKSGTIMLKNSVGSTESAATFNVEYLAPEVPAKSIPAEVEMGNKLLISGQRMNVISKVLFTAVGMTMPHQADVIDQNDHEIVVKIPYVESDDAQISFAYYDGKQEKTTPAAAFPVIKVKRYQPNVTTTTFAPVHVGDAVVLDGTYINKIEQVLLGSKECTITAQSETQLTFVVPATEDMVDGDNVKTLSIVYFDGVETKVLTAQFVVQVPFVYFWANRTTYGQGRDVSELASFFSPETGMVYHNSMWRETVDPISYAKQAATCSANQKPAVTESEYNSVNPYFFFSGVSAGNLQINSPAGSTGQLKNFYWFNNSANDYRVTGANANCYGTPVLTYLYLDPNKEDHLQLINEEKNGKLTKIDEQTFPIDVEAKTCRGINISSLANTVNQTVFAPGVFTVGEEKSADIDAYIMVFYYNVNGLGSNKAENIKRIGLLHIKHIDFKLYNNTNAPSSSSISFDMYWMKHDYKYSE